MDVADQIVVMNDGRVEQVGTPDELYDHPANEFVMSFLGPVTRLGERFVRPHDIEIVLDPDERHRGGDGASASSHLGFEMRVESCSPTAPRSGRR